VKAITLWQPWAQLVALGAKRLETRSWSTKYRGPLAIHAAQAFPTGSRAMVGEPEFFGALRTPDGFRYHEHNLPRGAVVAVAQLVAVCEIVELAEGRVGLFLDGTPYQATKDQDNLSEGVRALLGAAPSRPFPALERAFGDFKPGRFAWVLEDVRRLVTPVPLKGRQGLWEWTARRACSVPTLPTTAHLTTAPAPPSGVPLPTATAEPAPERTPEPAARLGLVEGMVQMAASDPRMRSGFKDCRMAFLRSFARAVIDAQEASR
jgi:hypothetical protein